MLPVTLQTGLTPFLTGPAAGGLAAAGGGAAAGRGGVSPTAHFTLDDIALMSETLVSEVSVCFRRVVPIKDYTHE